MKPRIFLDTDVIISATISQTGAGHTLLNLKTIEKTISNHTISEVVNVSKRLNLDLHTENLLSKCKIIKLSSNFKSLEKQYEAYVSDLNDTHVVTGAVNSNSSFLITYNLKDFNTEFIKRDFDITVLTPGMFLQYLRGRN